MRADSFGLLWEDIESTGKRGPRQLGPMPPIPETGWRPPTEFPNIRHAKWHAIDVETYDPELDDNGPGWARGVGHIVGLSVAVEGGKWYFPIRHEVERELNLDPAHVLGWAAHSLGSTSPKVGANIMYDVGWLRQEGVIVKGPLQDVQYAEALLSETSKLNLEALGQKYVGEGKDDAVLKDWARSYYMGSETRWRKDIYRCPVSLVGPYAERDATLPFEVLMKQWGLLSRNKLHTLFRMECDLINLLIDMRFMGIQIDLKYAEDLRGKFVDKAKVLQSQVDGLAGFGVNTNSGDSLAQAFDKLGLQYGFTAPSDAFPNGKPSFTGAFMQTVDHPFAKLVTELKGVEKLRSTFIESYLLNSHVNGKVYCSFHPLSGTEGGARTGRFASSDPNLQNIPVRSDDGKLIRAAFIMDHGHKQLRDYDYSQIEYRMLAHFATGQGSAEVREKYRNDPTLDYHKMIGAMIFEKTGRQLARGHVKNINFGLVYGLGIETLAMYLGVTVVEAKALSKAFHEAITFARATMDSITGDVNRSGIVETVLGRQSHFDLWEQDGWGKKVGWPLPYRDAIEKWGTNITRAYLYRAINYKLQGSAADIMKKGMVDCYNAGVFNVTGVPRLTVHDELLFSDPGNVPEDAWAEMKNVFETCIPSMTVPIVFEGGEGINWAEAH